MVILQHHVILETLHFTLKVWLAVPHGSDSGDLPKKEVICRYFSNSFFLGRKKGIFNNLEIDKRVTVLIKIFGFRPVASISCCFIE